MVRKILKGLSIGLFLAYFGIKIALASYETYALHGSIYLLGTYLVVYLIIALFVWVFEDVNLIPRFRIRIQKHGRFAIGTFVEPYLNNTTEFNDGKIYRSSLGNMAIQIYVPYRTLTIHIFI